MSLVCVSCRKPFKPKHRAIWCRGGGLNKEFVHTKCYRAWYVFARMLGEYHPEPSVVLSPQNNYKRHGTEFLKERQAYEEEQVEMTWDLSNNKQED